MSQFIKSQYFGRFAAIALFFVAIVYPSQVRGDKPDKDTITPIEDYDSCSMSRLDRLYRKIALGESQVRIAFLGDSFIEADIITADLRELLQREYGGCGAGYAPMDSPLTKFRPTIKTASKGWTTSNIMQYNKLEESLRSHFSFAGWISRPSPGATTQWRGTTARQLIDTCQRARLHFIAQKGATLLITINEEQPQRYEFSASDNLQELTIEHPGIGSLKLEVQRGTAGFYGYGVLFEGLSGIVLDNYSVRSNNGRTIFWSSTELNAQIDRAIGGYDLVILQYGLNIMQRGISKYTSYGAQVERMIHSAQESFPAAAIVVMGVSDRWIKESGAYTPMTSEAQGLTSFQRNAAEACGAGFWDTYAAMQSKGGMSAFVEQGWAAKDHTHINAKGGAQIAQMLLEAINDGVEEQRRHIIRRINYAPIIDPASRETTRSQLLRIELDNPDTIEENQHQKQWTKVTKQKDDNPKKSHFRFPKIGHLFP